MIPNRARWVMVLASLTAVLLVLGAVSLGLGAVQVSLSDIVRVLLGDEPSNGATEAIIIRELRLPRVLMAAIVGMSLGGVGATLQSTLRNPLADPYLLGVSSGAALGAVLAIGWGHAATHGFAFAGALGATVLIFALAQRHRRMDPHTLILAGVVLNAVLGAGITLAMILMQPHRIPAVVYWLLGSIRSVEGSILVFAATGLAVGLGVLLTQARALDLMTQGEETARQLGVSVERCKVLVLLASAWLTTLAVSYNGLIGFVGLIVPHAGRFLFGPDNRLLIPASALLGAATLVAADAAARTLLAPTELPVGALTALAGGPFFLILLRRSRGGFA